MTSTIDQGVVILDTQVISWLAKASKHGGPYRQRIAGRRIAMSYWVRTELDGYEWSSEARKERLGLLHASSLQLPPSDATSTWFNRVNRKRKEIGLAGRVDDNDCWIIAQALEFELPLMTHDAGMARLAFALGVLVETELPAGDYVAEPAGGETIAASD